MTNKLKNCPLCNFPHDGNLSCSNPRCSLYWVSIPIEQWENRPVERYLRDRLEAIDSGLTLPAQEEIERLKARIAELEAENKTLYDLTNKQHDNLAIRRITIGELRADLEQWKLAYREQAQAEPAWIPVSVRLPECRREEGAQSDRVACLTNILERTIGWVDWNTFEEGYTWDWIEKHFTGTYIIAWYPIPPVKVQE